MTKLRILENKKKKFAALLIFLCCIAVISLTFLCRPAFNSPVSAVLESSDGTLLGARIASDGQWRFPASDAVPEKFAKAIVTYEDKRFYRHRGIDMLAIARALRLNIKAGSVRSGGSTITMQTIRLSRPDKKRSIGEKIVEAVMARSLEATCSKKKILSLYASNAPFGGNVVGINAAARRYFGRPADELSWAESATLAVLPNAPALVHPGSNRNILLNKRNFLLDKLMKAGHIDSLECALAKEEPLPDKPYRLPETGFHYLETLRKSGGDRLYRSSLDYWMQNRAEEIIARHSKVFASNEVYNIAAVIIDVKTGEPLVYCGNSSHDKSVNGSNVDVVQAPRSSGSTLKPILYGAMLDEGLILPDMLIADTPFHFKDFTPSNYSHTFDGAVTARSVIQRSLNVPSVRMLQEYGVEKFIDLLRKCGFTTVNRGAEVYGLSLILGGAEIRLADLAAAYRSMALKLKDGKGSCPLSEGAVWCTFDALTEVNRPEEEGEWHNFGSHRKVAWKTGTSYGNRDAWSVGATPDYVVAVWVGNCSGEGRPLLTGVGYAAPVMFDLFSILPATGWFDIPYDSLEDVVTCSLSGHPASDLCEDDGTVNVMAPKAVRRPDPCPYHRLVHLSPDGQWQVDSDCCPVSEIVTCSRFVLPPAQEWYYMRSHSDYHALPPLHPDYAGSRGRSVLEIIYPQSGMTVAAPLALDSKSRGVVFSAAHNDPSARIFWHLDGTYIGSTSGGEHKIKVVPPEGDHLLTIVDVNGNTTSVRFTAL